MTKDLTAPEPSADTPPPKPPKTLKTRLGRASKWLFFILAFFLIILTVLGNIGGNSDELKASVEQYLQSATGYYADVQTLNNMAFFPDMIFDFEGVSLRAAPDDVVPVVTIARVHLITNFWSVMFRTGRVKALYVENITAQPGVWGKNAVIIDRLHIDDTLPDAAQAALRAVGRIGDLPMNAMVAVNVHSKNRWKTSYSFALGDGFALNVGEIAVTGKVIEEKNKSAFTDLRLTHNGVNVITGTLYPARDAIGNLRMTGDLTVAEHGTTIMPDIRIEHGDTHASSVNGTLTAAPFMPQDFAAQSRLDAALSYLNDIFQTPALTQFSLLNRSLSTIEQSPCINIAIAQTGENDDDGALSTMQFTPVENRTCE